LRLDVAATLYVVGTPLGNLADLSARAATCLRDVEVVYAEDTRRSRVLLDHLGLRKNLRSLHEHNEMSRTAEVLAVLARGESVALLTDAGTPAVSDPGADVVAAVHAAGFAVAPVAGPSALTAALSVAGFAGSTGDVLFVGFLPTRGKDMRAGFARVAAHEGCVVLFESPRRLAHTLEILAQSTPERIVCVCREMTKMYEEVVRRSATEMVAWAVGREILGEITLVLGPNPRPQVEAGQASIDAAITQCLQAGLSARDTATAVAAILGAKRRDVYARCQELG
jgi:16S rRNA (cytidine1402-2'-O)-methyltransferase